MQYMEEEMLKGKNLLVVDDEDDLRDIVASELEFMGAKVFQAENISKAQEILDSNLVDLIISDIRMPGGTGIDLLDAVKKRATNIPPMILITGFADITVEDAFNKGAEALINKPFKLDELIKMVVRYTSPIDKRFQESGTPSKSIRPYGVNHEMKFGRGGIAIKINTDGKRYDVGELVTFAFNHGPDHFQGTGICRWFKLIDQASNQAIMGLEFFDLDKESLNKFKIMNTNKVIVPYIPASF